MISFHYQFPLEGYRRLSFMMLDRDMVAVSPSSTYRVLKAAGVLQRWNQKASGKGNGFQQPVAPHEHWHVDISYRDIDRFGWGCRLTFRLWRASSSLRSRSEKI